MKDTGGSQRTGSQRWRTCLIIGGLLVVAAGLMIGVVAWRITRLNPLGPNARFSIFEASRHPKAKGSTELILPDGDRVYVAPEAVVDQNDVVSHMLSMGEDDMGNTRVFLDIRFSGKGSAALAAVTEPRPAQEPVRLATFVEDECIACFTTEDQLSEQVRMSLDMDEEAFLQLGEQLNR